MSAEDRERQVLDLLAGREMTSGELADVAPVVDRVTTLSGDVCEIRVGQSTIYRALERLRWKGVVLRRREDGRRRGRRGAGPVYVYFRAPGPLTGEIAQLDPGVTLDEALTAVRKLSSRDTLQRQEAARVLGVYLGQRMQEAAQRAISQETP